MSLEKIIQYNKKLLLSEQGDKVEFNGKNASHKVAFGFPAEYKIAMETAGFQQIYFSINKDPDYECERFFYPDSEMLKEYEKEKAPILTLESNKAINQKEMLFLSFNFELNYLRFLDMLEKSNIPAFSKDRSDRHPLLVGGGFSVTYNPNVLSEYLDVIVVGEAESTLPKILEEWDRKKDRQQFLKTISKHPGIYVPSLNKDGIVYKAKGFDIAKTDENYVMSSETFHKSILPLELVRGCTDNCKFCVLCKVFGKVSYQPLDKIKRIFDSKSKYLSRVRLISPSDTQHPQMPEVYKEVLDRGLELVVGAVRADSFSRYCKQFSELKVPNLNLAPETGSEDFRRRIAKNIKDEDFFYCVDFAAKNKIPKMELYFMVGFPGEKFEDSIKVADFVKKVRKRLDAGHQESTIVNVCINSHIRQAQTPYGLYPQQRIDEYMNIIDKIQQKLEKTPNIIITPMTPDTLAFETAVNRADGTEGRRLYDLLKDTKNVCPTQQQIKEYFDIEKYYKPLAANPHWSRFKM